MGTGHARASLAQRWTFAGNDLPARRGLRQVERSPAAFETLWMHAVGMPATRQYALCVLAG